MLNLNSKFWKIPEILWMQVFKYLTLKDFTRLRLVCKKLKEHADNFPDIYESECLRIFSSDLNLFQYFSNGHIHKF